MFIFLERGIKLHKKAISIANGLKVNASITALYANIHDDLVKKLRGCAY